MFLFLFVLVLSSPDRVFLHQVLWKPSQAIVSVAWMTVLTGSVSYEVAG